MLKAESPRAAMQLAARQSLVRRRVVRQPAAITLLAMVVSHPAAMEIRPTTKAAKTAVMAPVATVESQRAAMRTPATQAMAVRAAAAARRPRAMRAVATAATRMRLPTPKESIRSRFQQPATAAMALPVKPMAALVVSVAAARMVARQRAAKRLLMLATVPVVRMQAAVPMQELAETHLVTPLAARLLADQQPVAMQRAAQEPAATPVMAAPRQVEPVLVETRVAMSRSATELKSAMASSQMAPAATQSAV